MVVVHHPVGGGLQRPDDLVAPAGCGQGPGGPRLLGNAGLHARGGDGMGDEIIRAEDFTVFAGQAVAYLAQHRIAVEGVGDLPDHGIEHAVVLAIQPKFSQWVAVESKPAQVAEPEFFPEPGLDLMDARFTARGRFMIPQREGEFAASAKHIDAFDGRAGAVVRSRDEVLLVADLLSPAEEVVAIGVIFAEGLSNDAIQHRGQFAREFQVAGEVPVVPHLPGEELVRAAKVAAFVGILHHLRHRAIRHEVFRVGLIAQARAVGMTDPFLPGGVLHMPERMPKVDAFGPAIGGVPGVFEVVERGAEGGVNVLDRRLHPRLQQLGAVVLDLLAALGEIGCRNGAEPGVVFGVADQNRQLAARGTEAQILSAVQVGFNRQGGIAADRDLERMGFARQERGAGFQGDLVGAI